MIIEWKMWSTNIIVTQIMQTRNVGIMYTVSAWLVNVYTKSEIGDIDRNFSIDFENIFLT